MLLADRRACLRQMACGFGGLAFAALQKQELRAVEPDLLPVRTQFAPRAKRIIFVFMQGGPSHVDTFDDKPLLSERHGESHHFRDSRKLARTGEGAEEKILAPLWSFDSYGDCGRRVSELFPQIAQRVDDLCFLHGMHTEGVAHGPSTLFLHTGANNLVRPSIGAWIDYGLGSENQNLPGFVTICPSASNGGPRNYSSAFLPAAHQGATLGRAGMPADQVRFHHCSNSLLTPADQREQFELLREVNRAQLRSTDDDQALALLNSYELGWRMQQHAPELTDLAGETQSTLQLYGIGEAETDEFGRQCLLARRLAEAGVRYIQVSYADNTSNPRWDQHSNMPQHAVHARATDRPVAGLLTDLKARGLLEDTLVWWGGEFGRNPFSQGANGRDHNPRGFTHFLAGGGVKAGFAHGATDEFGHEAIEGKVHMHDLHATLLYLLGLDHEQLTYRHAGRDFRLTDVFGRVVHEILA